MLRRASVQIELGAVDSFSEGDQLFVNFLDPVDAKRNPPSALDLGVPRSPAAGFLEPGLARMYPSGRANESAIAMASRLRPLWSVLAASCAAAIAVAPTATATVDLRHLPQGGGITSSDAGPYGAGVPTVISGGPAPTMNGVPCVAGHLGTCIGFAQNQPPRRTPRTTLGHSPTVRR